MAIRFPHSGSVNVMGATFASGYRNFFNADDSVMNLNAMIFAASTRMFQPSRLSRPNNNGPGWTENVTSANDAHRPMPFKLLAATSLIYDTGLNTALMGR